MEDYEQSSAAEFIKGKFKFGKFQSMMDSEISA